VVWAALPLCWILLISLKTQVEAFTMPPSLIFTPTLQNYSSIFLIAPESVRNLENSVLVALSSTFASLLIGTPAGSALARLRFLGREIIAYGILWTSMVPVMGIVLPLFVIFRELLNTIVPLIIADTIMRLPLSVWLMMGFILDLPQELEEAAYVDGCSWVKMFTRILLPILLPSIAAAMILNFIFSWNEFMLAFTLTGMDSRTATVGLYNFMGHESFLWGPLTAYSIVITAPVVVFAFVVQRYIVRGLTFGAVKF
jgi:multiple sugar transport system permease protein